MSKLYMSMKQRIFYLFGHRLERHTPVYMKSYISYIKIKPSLNFPSVPKYPGLFAQSLVWKVKDLSTEDNLLSNNEEHEGKDH